MYVWSLLVIMMMGLTSCGDDDELQFSEEQLAYINKNKEYIWEKKTEKDEMGELRYKQVVLGGDTALYRIIRKENEWTTTPTMTSVVYLLGLEGKFIDGQVFQKNNGNIVGTGRHRTMLVDPLSGVSETQILLRG